MLSINDAVAKRIAQWRQEGYHVVGVLRETDGSLSVRPAKLSEIGLGMRELFYRFEEQEAKQAIEMAMISEAAEETATSPLSAMRAWVRENARTMIKRILENGNGQEKLADVSLTLRQARAGRPYVVPMSWDDDQRSLWELLANFHGLTK